MRARVAMIGLVLSAVSLALAPVALDDSYDWIRHTTSEAGAQGVNGAWLARTGFLLFGLSVLLVADACRRRWSLAAAACHRFFAVAMLAVAAFSLRSWEPGAPYDRTEDLLHSVAATAMGFAFAFGVTATALRLVQGGSRLRVLDLTAVAASVVLPIGMLVQPDIAGLLQRTMFAIAYLWYGREATGAAPGAAENSDAWPSSQWLLR